MSNHRSGMKITPRGAFLVGLAGALAGGALGSLPGRAVKPLAVGAINQGIGIRENVRARAAELREDPGDLVAQAEHEYRAQRRQAPGLLPPAHLRHRRRRIAGGAGPHRPLALAAAATRRLIPSEPGNDPRRVVRGSAPALDSAIARRCVRGTTGRRARRAIPRSQDLRLERNHCFA